MDLIGKYYQAVINKMLIVGLGRYLDKGQYKLFITIKDGPALIGRLFQVKKKCELKSILLILVIN